MRSTGIRVPVITVLSALRVHHPYIAFIPK